MKNSKPIHNLTPEEQEIENAIARGEYESVSNLEVEKERLAAVAKYTIEKRKVITLRVTGRDYMKVKAAAAREGIPYQTFITSLIHKNV